MHSPLSVASASELHVDHSQFTADLAGLFLGSTNGIACPNELSLEILVRLLVRSNETAKPEDFFACRLEI